MAHDIFISYSARDKTTADAVCANLEAVGIKCWIAPRDVLPGIDWSAAIVNAISNCRAMVLVFSSSANASTQIKREVERAVHKGKVIIPFRIEDVEPSGALEYFISTPHWLDAITPPMEKHISRLVGTVRSLLDGSEEMPGVQEAISPPRESGLISSPRKMPRRISWTFLLAIASTGVLLAAAALFFRDRQEKRAAESISVILPMETAQRELSKAAPDSWAATVTEARRYRSEGKTGEALAAFSKYEDLFGEKYPSTKQYVRTAQAFTLQCGTLGIAGGAYIYECSPKGEGAKAGLAVGDIIVGYGGYSVRGAKSYVESWEKMKGAKTVAVEFLRFDGAGHFERKSITADYGLLGIRLMDI
jgi:hypothetical protein